jgi:hypothetical protein
MIAVSGATGGSVFSSVTNTQKLWVLFDLGSSGKVSITRAICNAARSSGTFQSPYSDKTDCIETNCSDDLPRDEKGKLLTSKMRIEIAMKRLQNQLAIVHGDFAFNSGVQSPSLTNRISKQLQEINSQIEIGGIVIDGVGDVWGYEKNASPLSERQFISNFVSRFCRKLSHEYQCPVWVTHQVNGAACSALPIAPLSHSNSARCRTFADSLDACIVFGTKSNQGFFALQCTKHLENKAILDSVVLEYDSDVVSFREVQGLRVDRNKQQWVERANDTPLVSGYEKELLQQQLSDLRANRTTSQRAR